MHFRGSSEAAIAQRLWSLFHEMRTRDADRSGPSDLERFGVELGQRLNARIAHGPERLFTLPYDGGRVRAWAEGEGLALDGGSGSGPAQLVALWTRLCEGREHSPWALIERWDASADALAEAASALQPALFHRWNLISCVERSELAFKLDDAQRVELRAFVSRGVGEYWIELLELDEPLADALRAALEASPRTMTADRFARADALGVAVRERVKRRSTRAGITAEDVTRALYDSVSVFVAIAFGVLRSPGRDDSASLARAWWLGSAPSLAELATHEVATIEARLAHAIRCPDLRALVELARASDTRSAS
ncbi:MAG: hypothetical protein JNK05_13995 [Myxococcales bacterium]|nr:hypothetical protein [Myxococcales bacterium]